MQNLKRKEREFEHEMERLAREKISHQQHLASLKKELAARWDHLDFNTILPDMSTIDHQRDKETKSTTTASEQPDIEEEHTVPSTVVNDRRFATNFSSQHSSAAASIASPLLSSGGSNKTNALFGSGVLERGSLPIMVPSSPVTFVRARANLAPPSGSSTVARKTTVPSRQSPVCTFPAAPDGLNMTSVVTYTPQPSPQPGLLGTCTQQISPQAAPIVTYTPQPSPQSPTTLAYVSQVLPQTLVTANNFQTVNTFTVGDSVKLQREVTTSDSNQPLNLSTNTVAKLSSTTFGVTNQIPFSPIHLSHSLPSVSSNALHASSATVQETTETSTSWLLQHDKTLRPQLQNVELKVIEDPSQIIRNVNSTTNVALDNSKLFNSVSTSQVITSISNSAITLNRPLISAGSNLSFCPENPSFNFIQNVHPSSSELSLPSNVPTKTPIFRPSGLPPGVAMKLKTVAGATNELSNSFNSVVTSEGYTLRLAPSATAALVPGTNGALKGTSTTVMVPQAALHHIPVRITASAGNLVNIITPDMGYKIFTSGDATSFPTPGKPITIALPHEGE